MKKTVQIIIILLLLAKTSICFGYGSLEVDTNIVITNFPTRFANLIPYKDVQPLVKGFIDVTKGPYFAKGDSLTDDTQAIQNAINDAFDGNYVVFFPGDKVYLVSSQLNCDNTFTTPSHKFGFQLLGSTKGKKPVIKLKDNSTVTGNILVFYDAKFTTVDPVTGVSTIASDPSRHYSAQFRGIDINMGTNPNIHALTMNGAQYCSIEDVRIYGKSFNSGIYNLPGSGGNTENVSVDGGNYGIWQNSYRPNPTITGLTLTNQIISGIRLTMSRGPLIVTGFKIVSPSVPSGSYNAVYANCGSTPSNVQGSLCLTDGSIEVFGASGKAIYNNSQDITINNVYVKSNQIIANSSLTKALPGNATSWNKIASYVFTTLADKSTVYGDFLKLNNQSASFDLFDPLVVVSMPIPDFTGKHVWGTMPSWEDTNLVDITAYGATPENVNNKDDDGIAIQNAINDVTNPVSVNFGKTVFIPRGHFHISASLSFKSGLKIIGASKSISAIQSLKEKNYAGVPFIQSADDANGSLVMSDFAIVIYANMTLINIRTNNTIFRDITTEHVPTANWVNPATIINLNKQTAPTFSFTGNAGGKIYGICADHISSYVATIGRIPFFQILYVTSKLHPLSFYQLSIEHRDNMPQMMYNNAKNVSVYGLKYEGTCELLNILNSDSIQIIGGSGNYSLENAGDKAIIVINNSKNINIQNVCRKPPGTVADITKFWIRSEKDSTSGDYSVLSYKINDISMTPVITPINSNYNSDLKVYTNDKTKELIIDGISANEMIEMYNAQGVKVLTVRNTEDKIAHININKLALGVYILKVNNETVKFINKY